VAGTSGLTAGTGNIILDNPANNFGGVVTVTSSTDLNLDDANTLTLGAVNATGNAQFDAAGAINFTGVATIGGNLLASSIANGGAGANITDTGAGQLLVTGTSGLTAGTGNVILDNVANNFGGAVSVISSTLIEIDDANTLTLGTINATSDARFDAAGAIDFTGVATIGGNLLASSIVNGGAGANITDTGAGRLLITGTSGLTAGTGNIILDNPANNFGGVVTVTSSTDLNLDDANTLTLGTVNATGNARFDSAGLINFTGVTTIGGNLLADSIANGGAGANITDTGAGQLLVTGTSGLTAGTGNVILDNVANNFGGAVIVTSSTLIEIDDANTLTLGTVNASGDAKFDAAGAVDFTGVATIGGNLLASSIANGGAGANITDTGAGQLLVTGTSGFTAGTGNIILDNPANNFVGAVSMAANSINIIDANTILLGNVDSTTSLSVKVLAGGITQTPAPDIVSARTHTTLEAVGDIALMNANRLTTLTVVGAGNVAIRDVDSAADGANQGLTLVGANNFTGTAFVIATDGGLRFKASSAPVVTQKITGPAGSKVVLIGGETKGLPGVNEVSGNRQPGELVSVVNLDPDLDVFGSDIFQIANSLQSTSAPAGSYIRLIHGVPADPIRNLKFNYTFAAGGVTGILNDAVNGGSFGGPATFGSLSGLLGDTSVFFSSAPYIDLAISDAAELARNMLKKGIVKTDLMGKVDSLVDSGAVAAPGVSLVYFGPYWTIGYDYDQYVSKAGEVPPPKFPLYYYKGKDGNPVYLLTQPVTPDPVPPVVPQPPPPGPAPAPAPAPAPQPTVQP
jgi:hypothetical protein